MIYTKKTRQAMILAELMHRGQYDKAGFPYINHVLTVADKMDSEAATIVALLHDTVEDMRSIQPEDIDKIPKQVLSDLEFDIESFTDLNSLLRILYSYGSLNEAVDSICDAMQFSDEVRQSLKLITRDKSDGKTYIEYIKSLSNNAIARQVKLADLSHNMDKSRFIDTAYPEKLTARYISAMDILESVMH